MSHPNDRLPWFRCFPTALLGALAGMESHTGYIYVTVLLRIYETGGAVSETPDTLSRRTGLPKKRIWEALEYLLEMGKLEQVDGRFDSRSTHSEIVWQTQRREQQKTAGKMSASKRQPVAESIVIKSSSKIGESGPENLPTEKTQQNQGNCANDRSTSAQRSFNHLDLDLKKEKKEKEMNRVWVARDTPEWTAWQKVKRQESIFSTERQENGWWFKTRWPPEPIPNPTTKEAAE